MPRASFLVAFTATCAATVAAVATANYTLDVGGVYGHSSQGPQTYVDRLLSSKAGLVKPQSSERRIKEQLVARGKADCYVTGSSHEMGLSLDRAPSLKAHCGSLINLAVPGGSYEDALITMHAVAGRKGSVVILGIGPWFYKRNSDSRWQELGDAYARARGFFFHELGQAPVLVENGKLRNLINGDYFLRNVKSVLSSEREAFVAIEADGDALREDDAIIRQDGSLSYSRQFVAASHPRKEDVACSDYKVAQPYVDQMVVAEFASAVEHLRESGIRLVFQLTPYHPGVYKCTTGHTVAALKAAEEATRQLSVQLDAPVWGAYDPKFHGMTGQDFFDLMHVDTDSLWKLKYQSDSDNER